MTIIVTVKKNGMTAIGVDSLTSYGTALKLQGQYKENSDKLVQIGDSYVALTGSTTWKLIFKEHFNTEGVEYDFSSTATIYESLRQFHRVLVNKYHIQPTANSGDFFSSNFNGMIVNRNGIFEFGSERSVMQYSKFGACGSGFQYALGAMHALYDTGATAEEIAHHGLRASCQFDPGSAEPLLLRTIQPAVTLPKKRESHLAKSRRYKLKTVA